MSESDDLSRVTSAHSVMEAAPIVAALERAGIKAVTGNANSATMIPEAMGEVEVLVANHDLPRALTLIQLIEEHGTDVDWSQVDVGEPED
ncbi:putative signal transducing protein [Aeoliella sp.]|uniref:putative signal transducing protein n=1 Tax=Aeoliella sp. TaxID=2795800 RepID=UPI003CCB7E01